MAENIIVALITAAVTIIGGYLTFSRQRQQDLADVALATEKLKIQVEADLWQRMQEQLKKMSDRIDALESENSGLVSTIKEQGEVIMQLRDRIKALEEENVRLQAENTQLKKQVTGGRKI